VLKAGWGTEVISYRSAQKSARPEQVLLPALLPVPRPLPGPLSVSGPLPGQVSVSACSREQQGRLYILSH